MFSLVFLLGFGALLVSNKSSLIDQNKGRYKHFARDSFKYQQIVNSEKNSFREIHQHFLERFIFLKIIGKASSFLKVNPEEIIKTILYISIFIIFFTLKKILSLFKFNKHMIYFVLMATLWNGYFLRYYLEFSYMFLDILFVCFVTLFIFYALKPESKINFAKQVVVLILALLCKQTVILLIPFFVYKAYKQKKKILPFIAIIVLVGTYFGLHQYALSYSIRGQHLDHSLGLFYYFGSEHFDLLSVIKLLLGSLIPLFIPIFILLFAWLRFGTLPKIKDQLGLTLLFVAVTFTLQPIMAGPDFTQEAATRLGSLALIPWTIFMAYLLKEFELTKIRKMESVFVFVLLLLLSLHFVFIRGTEQFSDYPYFAITFTIVSLIISYGFVRKLSLKTDSINSAI